MRASLRAEYQVRDIRDERVLDLAGMVVWLSPGCALWRSVGGPLAWSEETHLLNVVEFRLRTLVWMQTEDAKKGRNRPKPPEAPKYAGELSRESDAMARKAEAHRRRSKVG